MNVTKHENTKIGLNAISLPSGGGSMGVIGEEFHANEFTGTFSFSHNIPASKCRTVDPSISIDYHSGGGNSPFGLGFNVNIPQITVKTTQGTPKYNADDTFMWGGENLVPLKGGPRKENGYEIQKYHTRTMSEHDIIEHYICTDSTKEQRSFWLVIDEHHIIHIFGRTKESQIYDADSSSDSKIRIFTWLCDTVIHPTGDALLYQYKADGNNKYISKILYGNHTPLDKDYITNPVDTIASTPISQNVQDWHFIVGFDYGEYEAFSNNDDESIAKTCNLFTDSGSVDSRLDTFVSYKPGFRLETNRLCRNVLVFHNFRDEFGVDFPVLVHRTYLQYAKNEIITKLKSITEYGYQFSKDGVADADGQFYKYKKLPSIDYSYSEFNSEKHEFKTLKEEQTNGSLKELDITNYSFFDLYGEGIPGLLYTDHQVMMYRSPKLNDSNKKTTVGNICYSKPQTIDKIPTHAIGTSNAKHHLLDITGNGFLDWLVATPYASGYYELIRKYDVERKKATHEWESFRVFDSFPTEFTQPFAKLLDITGDALSDCVINCGNKIRYYQSQGKKGFLAPKIEEQNKTLPAHEPSEKIFIDFLDILGTGSKHLVRITEDEIKYWPHYGYGKFGDPITIKDFPKIKDFAVKRLHLLDIDGSGAPDLLYMHQDRIAIYLNYGGNSFASGYEIKLPTEFNYHNLVQIESADIYGNGTQCLVLNNPITNKSLYCDFCNGQKPHLLTKIDNNMGAVTNIGYCSSSYYYLKSKSENKDWFTQLPFPVHVINRIENSDKVSNISHISVYDYYHGYYDAKQREFRGFGRVDRQDAELCDLKCTESTAADYSPPALTKTWYHTGYDTKHSNLAIDLPDLYNTEYFAKNQKGAQYIYTPLKSVFINSDHQPMSEHDANSYQAHMSLAGKVLRTEVYGLDSSNKQSIPYSIHDNSYCVKLLQQQADNKYAIFLIRNHESIDYVLERYADDPRITHHLVLDADKYANETKLCTIHYGRKNDNDLKEQTNTKIVYEERCYINNDTPKDYQIGIPSETKQYEICENDNPTGWKYSFDEVKQIIDDTKQGKGESKGDKYKLLNWERYIYSENNENLDLSKVELPALLAEHQVAMYSDEQIKEAYKETDLTPDSLRNLLRNEGYFQLRDKDNNIIQDPSAQDFDSLRSYWWNNGLTAKYDDKSFYLMTEVHDQQGNVTYHTYDKHKLVPKTHKDAVGNETKVDAIDYQFLLPIRTLDANKNTSEVMLDPLGHVIYTSHYGSQISPEDNKSYNVGFGNLEDLRKSYSCPTSIDEILQDPAKHIQKAASYYYYDYDSWQSSKQPVHHLHVTAMEYPEADIPHNKSTEDNNQVHIEYIDGFGRSIQSKMRVEEGLSYIYDSQKQTVNNTQEQTTDRWLSSGRKRYNNKAKVIEAYEPYYINTASYIPHAMFDEVGYSHKSFYDALDRVYKVITTKGFLVKHEWTAWGEESWDENNCISESPYYKVNINNSDDPSLAKYKDPEFSGLDKNNIETAATLYNVSTKVDYDNLGHTLIQEQVKRTHVNEAGDVLKTKVVHDILGRVLSSSDPRLLKKQLCNLQNIYGLAHSGVLMSSNVDFGKRWHLNDYVGKTIYTYNERGISTTHEYDAIHRPISIATSKEGSVAVSECFEYGDTSKEIKDPEKHNLRGKIYKHYHQSGIRSYKNYNILGKSLDSSQQLVLDYQYQPHWKNKISEVSFEGVNKSNGLSEILDKIIYTDMYEYNALGLITLKRNHFRDIIYNEYFISGRLGSISVYNANNKGKLLHYVKSVTYNAKNQRECVEYANGMRTTYDYDVRDWKILDIETKSNASQSSILHKLQYKYDAVGNIIERITESAADIAITSKYAYDTLYQLSHATGKEILPEANKLTDYREEYTYDNGGNLVTKKHNNNLMTMLVDSESNKAIEKISEDQEIDTTKNFDKNGNLQQIGNIQCNWNHYDHLQNIKNPDKNLREYYQYEHLIHRTRKTSISTQTPKAILEDSVYLGDYEIRKNSFNGESIYILKVNDGHNGSINIAKNIVIENLAPSRNNAQVRYQLQDILNSCNVEVNENQQIVSHEEFTPYGERSFHKIYDTLNDKSGVIPDTKYYRYSNKEKDAATGLYYYGARYYIPTQGRWLSSDPAGYVDGHNTYVFVNGNPTSHIDLMGLAKKRGKTPTTKKTKPKTIKNLGIDHGSTEQNHTKQKNKKKLSSIHDESQIHNLGIDHGSTEQNHTKQKNKKKLSSIHDESQAKLHDITTVDSFPYYTEVHPEYIRTDWEKNAWSWAHPNIRNKDSYKEMHPTGSRYERREMEKELDKRISKGETMLDNKAATCSSRWCKVHTKKIVGAFAVTILSTAVPLGYYIIRNYFPKDQ